MIMFITNIIVVVIIVSVARAGLGSRQQCARTLALQISSGSCSAAPDLVLRKSVFPPAPLSEGVFLSQSPCSERGCHLPEL